MLHIRHVKSNELNTLRGLLYQSVHQIAKHDYTQQQLDAWAPEQYNQQEWAIRLNNSKPFAVLYQQQIVAFADLLADGYIDHFFCHYLFQKRGIGRALMRHLFHEGKRLKIGCFHAQVSITAKPFFEKMGFAVIKQQQVYFGEQSLTNYIVEKRISYDI